ncbi:hypothetical protein ACFQI7_30870 [Paenibacillus allorhizosphaerae]|uniref:Uncharacterized protein n=1 Tax=Paenibacillus allorhizosphaerae TaxID=2849866 RepID=A0ABN7TRR3_9BACL|nr:hypothetical protein [Paenibacillus allorhizosphaerae]CAG7653149.1 hypothetical protein PAECIP111802_05411 [Paenibacillus allorhizosphaerae]
MNRKRTLPTITKPFTHVHNTLTALGFSETPCREGTLYELTFHDPATLKQYPYRIPTQTKENGQTEVQLPEAGFCGKQFVPESAEAAAVELLTEVQQYLENGQEKKAAPSIDQVMNGKMANNEAEVKKLGKVMASIPTNSELRKNGLVPDPIQ